MERTKENHVLMKKKKKKGWSRLGLGVEVFLNSRKHGGKKKQGSSRQRLQKK